MRTKISYEDNGKESTVEIEGKSGDIFKALCRIAVSVKDNLKLSDEKMHELLKEGMQAAKKEKELTEKLKDKCDKDDMISLLDLLKEIFND